MTQGSDPMRLRRLKTPRAAAVAGILFALLFGVSLLLLRVSLPEDPFAGTGWVEHRAGTLTVALTLMPFAGISFLWFVGVIRDELGDLEDRFFSTVFLGSGLLFLAMVFVALAIAGGLLASAQSVSSPVPQEEVVQFGRSVMLQITNVYALRMAGVFMISLGTIWLRTGLMPRWVVGTTYLLALGLLLVVSLSLWVTFVFPAWALMVSVVILLRPARATAPSE